MGVVLVKSKRTERDGVFSAFCASLAWWNYFYYMWMASTTSHQALWNCRLIFLGTPFSAATLFHFVSIFSGKREKRRFSLLVVYALASFLGALSFTSLILSGTNAIMVFPFWPTAGPWFSLQGILNCTLHLLTFIDLFRTISTSTGVKKEQGRYIAFSSLIAVGGSLTNYFPFHGIQIKPYGNIFIFVQLAMMTYVILKYRLLGLNLMTRNALVYGLFGLILSGPLLLIVWMGSSPLTTALIVTTGILLAPVFFQKVRDVLERTVDTLPVFGERYAGFRTLQTSLSRLETSQTIEEWSQGIVEIVQRVYPADKGNLLFWDEGQSVFMIKAGWGISLAEQMLLSLACDRPLTEQLKNRKEVLIAEMLAETQEDKEHARITEDLTFLHAAVSIPIFHENQLRAILNIGSLPDERMFNELELAHLGNLVRAAEHSLAIVLSGTEKLKNTALLAHDLIKPFTPKGSVQKLIAIAEGRLGDLPEQARQNLRLVISDLSFVGEHLKKIVQPDKVEAVKITSCVITNVYERAREKYASLALEHGIDWRVLLPPDNLQVLCDLPLIEHRVIANLLDNAFRYTPCRGTIELGSQVKDGMFIGWVRDTGPGIDRQNQAKIFNYGVQLEKSRAGEAGLGLYSVKSVIEANGGTLWLESEPGKGSVFYFQLTLAKNL